MNRWQSNALLPRLVTLAESIEDAVLVHQKRADLELSNQLARLHSSSTHEKFRLSQAVFSLFRWRGWLADRSRYTTTRRLLAAALLDAHEPNELIDALIRELRINPLQIRPFAKNADWHAQALAVAGLLQIKNQKLDPNDLVPNWVRSAIATLPHGQGTEDSRWLGLLHSLQRPPVLWIRAIAEHEAQVWESLRQAQIDVQPSPQIPTAAIIPSESHLYTHEAFTRGEIEIQDIASQCVALVCDPTPGDRWWDVCAGAGGKSLHIASLMRGKGVIVATDSSTRRLQEAVRRIRRSPYHNITTRQRERSKRVAKSAIYDGVLVDAPCSGMGTWRRNPDARWTTARDSLDRLALIQLDLLRTASSAVKVGGVIVYSVCTFSRQETTDMVPAFLQSTQGFQLDPFPNPLNGDPTDGTLQIWPADANGDAMFIARFIRVGPGKSLT